MALRFWPLKLTFSLAGKNESEEKRELVFKEDGQGILRPFLEVVEAVPSHHQVEVAKQLLCQRRRGNAESEIAL